MKNMFLIIICVVLSANLVAKEFDVNKVLEKCKKCHGENYTKDVLHKSRDISKFTEEELIIAFDAFVESNEIGRKRLMKVILKKYSPEQRKIIAKEIYKASQNYKKKGKDVK